MSRTQDLVVARLRILAARWWAAPGPVADEPQVRTGEAELVGARARRPAELDFAEAGPEDLDPDDLDPDDLDPGQSSPGEPDPGEPDPGEPDHRGRDAPGTRGPGSLRPNPNPPPAGSPRTWLALGGLVCAAALLVAGAVAVRGWPRAHPPTAAPVAAPVDLRPLGEPSPSASVVVHVAGEVREPGIVWLPAGARVADALRAAGGLRRGGRLGPTNLARVVADGERIEIGGLATDPVAGGAGGAAGRVDLNSATAAQLDALPGVGPVTAAKILAWRSEHGRFSVVDELAEVPGIGPKTLEELRPLVTV